MNRAPLRRAATTWAILLGCGFALVRCGSDRVAGSSVTTGNPTEIQVSFTGENGPVAVAGRVEIYAATQIPVPGFRPEPLARHDVDGNSFTLTASHFESIADSLWPAGSLQGDSLASFNLVITGSDQGAILRDLLFRRKEARFSLKEGAWTTGKGGAARLEAGITPLAEYRAFIDPRLLSADRWQFLFLTGTGYAAKADSGKFSFPGLPAGNHELSFVSVPDWTKPMGNEDSVSIYGVNRNSSSDVDTLTPGSFQIRLPMPDDYKP